MRFLLAVSFSVWFLLYIQVARATKTRGVLAFPLKSNGKVSYINITIGDSQALTLMIDTFSPNNWVLGVDAFPTCYARWKYKKSSSKASSTASTSLPCPTNGYYDSSSDENFDYLSFAQSTKTISINRTDVVGIHIEGLYGTSNLSLVGYNTHLGFKNNFRASAVTFVEVESSNRLTGSFGLGLAPVGYNFLDAAYSSGLLYSASYSLFLDSSITSGKDNNGELIMGGFSKDHYIGDLYQMNIIPLGGNSDLTMPIITLSGLSITGTDGKTSSLTNNSDFTRGILIDSRARYTYLPEETMINLAFQLNAVYESEYSRWILDCSYRNLNITINFEFFHCIIKVPLYELIFDVMDSTGENNTDICLFGVTSDKNAGISVLGASFLRSALLVVDREGGQVALAQAYVSGIESIIPNLFTTPRTYETTYYAISSKSIPLAVTMVQSSTPYVTISEAASTGKFDESGFVDSTIGEGIDRRNKTLTSSAGAGMIRPNSFIMPSKGESREYSHALLMAGLVCLSIFTLLII